MRRLSLRKMLVYYMVIATLLTSLVGLVIEKGYNRDFYQQQIDYTEKILGDVCRLAEQELEDITDVLFLLAEKNSVYNFCLNSPAERYEAYKYIRVALDSFTETETSVVALYLYCQDGSFVRSIYSPTGMNYSTLKGFYCVKEREDMSVPFHNARCGRVFTEEDKVSDNDMNLYAVCVPIYGEKGYCGALMAMLDVSSWRASARMFSFPFNSSVTAPFCMTIFPKRLPWARPHITVKPSKITLGK